VDEKLQAIPAPAIKDTDVMPHSLGVAVQDRVSDARYCSVILKRNTPLPCQAAKTYSSVSADQTEFNITVLQGEDGRPATDCLTVAEKALVLAARNPDKESVKVTMGYDESGLVSVTVEDLISGTVEDVTIDFYAKV